MPLEDGMRKATKNLDKAAGAAPTSDVVHANDPGQQHDDDHNKEEVVKQNDAEVPDDEPDDG